MSPFSINKSYRPTVFCKFNMTPNMDFSNKFISLHIYREGNCCADKHANMGHSLQGVVWLFESPQMLKGISLETDLACLIIRFP